MNILSQIQKISIEVDASLKDDFVGHKHFEIELPGEFPSGDGHKISYNCFNCKGNIFLNLKANENFVFKKSMTLLDDNKVAKFEFLGNLLKLSPKFRIDNNGIYVFYNFSFTGKYKSVADIAGFHCPHCQSKYMMSYACYEGENEKAPEPDIVYIDKILMVDMDFGELRGMV